LSPGRGRTKRARAALKPALAIAKHE
jgi:hypothetical protein